MADLLQVLSGLQGWAYLAVFASALVEAAPGVGLLAPGQTLVVAAGAVARLGPLEPAPIAIAAAAGAITGDAVGYALGRSGGRGLILRGLGRFGVSDEDLDDVRDLLESNAALAIVGGRFNSLTRAIVPFVAGSVGFPRGRFMAYNVAGGVLWAAAFTTLGFAAGEGYAAAEDAAGTVGAIAFLATALAIAAAWWGRERLRARRRQR